MNDACFRVRESLELDKVVLGLGPRVVEEPEMDVNGPRGEGESEIRHVIEPSRRLVNQSQPLSEPVMVPNIHVLKQTVSKDLVRGESEETLGLRTVVQKEPFGRDFGPGLGEGRVTREEHVTGKESPYFFLTA